MLGVAGVALLVRHASPVQWDGPLSTDRGAWTVLVLWASVVGAIGGAVEGTLTRWVHPWAGAAVCILAAGVGIWVPVLLSGPWGGNFDIEGESPQGWSSVLGAGIAGWCLFLVLRFGIAWAVASAGTRARAARTTRVS